MADYLLNQIKDGEVKCCKHKGFKTYGNSDVIVGGSKDRRIDTRNEYLWRLDWNKE